MSTVFGLNYYVFCILVLLIVLYFTKNVRDEGFFGMSPGTLDQLSSTRVPTMNNVIEQEAFEDDSPIFKELYKSINTKK
jgi:hypothetical protein